MIQWGHRNHYQGEEKRRRGRGRRSTDLPVWVSVTVALLAAVQPIIIAALALLK